MCLIKALEKKVVIEEKGGRQHGNYNGQEKGPRYKGEREGRQGTQFKGNKRAFAHVVQPRLY